MFKEDVGQVLAWLTDHGEPFLARQTAIGKSSQRAEQLYNAHMQFEQVRLDAKVRSCVCVCALSAHVASVTDLRIVV